MTGASVVVAAGGLGTRVAGWAAYLPKEFYPVAGRPGIAHLLDEIAALGPAHVVVVYHPYYEPFFAWARAVLVRGGLARYQTLARQPSAAAPCWQRLEITFLRQHGRYADLTSVLNGAHLLPTGDLLVAFADNLYPHVNPLAELAAVQAGVPTVLARPFTVAEATQRGVIVCSGNGSTRTLHALVEKPDPEQAAMLAERYGRQNLRLLEGRARLSHDLVAHLAARPAHAPSGEPKLSLSLADYARSHQVRIITTTSPVIDLGSPSTLPPSTPTAPEAGRPAPGWQQAETAAEKMLPPPAGPA